MDPAPADLTVRCGSAKGCPSSFALRHDMHSIFCKHASRPHQSRVDKKLPHAARYIVNHDQSCSYVKHPDLLERLELLGAQQLSPSFSRWSLRKLRRRIDWLSVDHHLKKVNTAPTFILHTYWYYASSVFGGAVLIYWPWAFVSSSGSSALTTLASAMASKPFRRNLTKVLAPIS